MSAPLCLRLQEALRRAGDAHHVAEAGEDHLGVLCGDRDAVVDPAHRHDADGAAGAVDELDVLGEEVVDAVLVDGVGVPAADLHQLVVAVRVDLVQDLAGQDAAELGIAELVDELHAGHLLRFASGVCGRVCECTGVDEELVARGHFAHERDLDRFCLPLSFVQSASMRSVSTRSTRSGRATSPQVMQPSSPTPQAPAWPA